MPKTNRSMRSPAFHQVSSSVSLFTLPFCINFCLFLMGWTSFYPLAMLVPIPYISRIYDSKATVGRHIWRAVTVFVGSFLFLCSFDYLMNIAMGVLLKLGTGLSMWSLSAILQCITCLVSLRAWEGEKFSLSPELAKILGQKSFPKPVVIAGMCYIVFFGALRSMPLSTLLLQLVINTQIAICIAVIVSKILDNVIANGENPLGKFIAWVLYALLVMPAAFYTSSVFICNAQVTLFYLWKSIGHESLYENDFLPIAFSQIFAICLFESLFACNALLVTSKPLFVYLGVTCVTAYIGVRRVGELNQVTSIIDDLPPSQIPEAPASEFKEVYCGDPALSAAQQKTIETDSVNDYRF